MRTERFVNGEWISSTTGEKFLPHPSLAKLIRILTRGTNVDMYNARIAIYQCSVQIMNALSLPMITKMTCTMTPTTSAQFAKSPAPGHQTCLLLS